jgi:hypothetical protein
MISREEYDAAIAEVPNLEGLARKVEKTLETPPPEEKPPPEAPGEGPVILDEPPGSPRTSPESVETQGTEVDGSPPEESPDGH